MLKRGTILGILLMLLLVGCSSEQPTQSQKSFIGGNQGLEISFLSDRPPQDVFDTNFDFNIGVKLENKGEWDVTKNNVEVSVTGILPSSFGVSQQQLISKSPDDLKGMKLDASGSAVVGDYTNVEFPTMKYQGEVSGSIQYPILANVCYEYGTKAVGKLCVRKDLNRPGTGGLCNPTSSVELETSGGPIQIKNMKQNVAGSDKIDVYFTIQKTGASADSLHKLGTNCDTKTISTMDVVYVDVKPTGLGDITCSGLRDGTVTAGYITLFDGSREIRCTQKINSPADLVTPINIVVTYGYKQFVSTTINVKHSTG